MSTIKKLVDRFFGLENGIHDVLFNIITIAGMTGGFFSLCSSFFIKVPTLQVIAILFAEFVIILAFFLFNYKHLKGFGAFLLCVVVTDVLFPVIFFTGGGVRSGTPLWFAIGIIFSFLLMTGWALWVVVAIDILTMGTCFLMAYLHPEWVTSIGSEATFYIDVFQCALVISLVVGIINLFQVGNYSKLLKQNEKQRIQLEEANRVKTEFISQMSHEIRTPINAILGFNEMIARDTMDQNIKSYSHDIYASGQELLSMVNRLFNLDLETNKQCNADFVAPNVKILVVDDVELNCKVLCGLLRDTKMQMEVAYSGKDALQLCKEQKFDLIFMDHMMPEMNGDDCMRAIREDKNGLNENTPIVVVTANTLEGMEEKYLANGFAAYIPKPICADRLMEVILQILPAGSWHSADSTQEENKLGSLVDLESLKLAGFDPSEMMQDAAKDQCGATDTNAKNDTDDAISLTSYLQEYLDVETGLNYCAGDTAFYEEVIEDYFTNTKLVKMKEFFENEQWDDYRIVVHALKSTSLTIGASQLSEHSKALEYAVKDDNIDYVREHHDEVYEEYQQLLCDISLGVMSYKTDLANKDCEKASEVFSARKVSESRLNGAVSNEERIVRMTSDSVADEDTFMEESFDLGNAKLIVVDDDPFNIKMAEKLLGEKYTLDSANDGYEALEKIFSTHYDLILLDIHMPRMDGHETLKMIREKPEYDSVPVVFLTADNDIEAEAAGFDEGANDFIRKPFDHMVLNKRIERLLELSYLQKNLQKEVTKQTAKAETRRIKLEYLSDQLVQSLANTIDAKDKYTNGHSTRVAKYSVMIGKKLGYIEEQLKHLEYIGLLHDVGKIGVPDTIINKRSKLTDEEYEIIKQHPVIGHKILNQITEIRDIGVGARWHHERFDGTGYPDQLKGEDIPEVARIICVADAYDAMTSKRSYRDILPQEVVRKEIEDGMGTQFDPHFAKVMLEIIDEDTEYTLHE